MPTLRDQYKADVLVQLVQGGAENNSAYNNTLGPNGRIGGSAYIGSQYGEYSVAIVVASMAAGSGVLAHEVGHIFGGDHEPGKNLGIVPYAQAYTFEVNQQTKREVMGSGGGNIPHFGNPDVYYEGVATGIPNQFDNARIMRETAPYTQNFQPSISTPNAYIDGNLFPPYTGYYQYEAVHMCYPASSFQWWVSEDGWNYSPISSDESFYLFIPPYEQNLYLKLTVTYAGGLEATTYQTIYTPYCSTCRVASVEQSTDSELVVFPNPATETATLKFSLSEKSEVSRFVANMQGQIVQKASYGTLQPGTHEQTVDVRSLPPESYLVNLRLGKQTIRQKLLITR